MTSQRKGQAVRALCPAKLDHLTFAWLNLHRRLSKDYEVLTDNSETMIYIAMTRLMLRRLKPV